MGKAQAAYGYRAYGQADESMTQERDPHNADAVLDQKSAATNPLNQYRYSAKRLDPASGTLDMGARRFSPDTEHFLQEDGYKDALGDLGLASDPLTQNRYSLAGGNPVSFIEADGHEPISSYRDRRSVNRPYVRRARTRRQQSSQTADSYDRANTYQPNQIIRRPAAPTQQRAGGTTARRATPAPSRSTPRRAANTAADALAGAAEAADGLQGLPNPAAGKAAAVVSGGLRAASRAARQIAGQTAKKGLPRAGASALEDASQAAFKAADGSISISKKHLPGAAGRYNKFAEGVDVDSVVREGLRSPKAIFRSNPGGGYRIDTDLGRAIGQGGRTSVRTIVAEDGRVITSFPYGPEAP